MKPASKCGRQTTLPRAVLPEDTNNGCTGPMCSPSKRLFLVLYLRLRLGGSTSENNQEMSCSCIAAARCGDKATANLAWIRSMCIGVSPISIRVDLRPRFGEEVVSSGLR